MILKSISLRKFLRMCAADQKNLDKEIKEDIRNFKKFNETGVRGNAFDFYGVWWADAKNHIAGKCDIEDITPIRVREHAGRQRLYPALTQHFLSWLREKQRWTNQGISLNGDKVHGAYEIPSVGTSVGVKSIMPLDTGDEKTRYYYPYFSEDTALNDEVARMGLFIMQSSLAVTDINKLRLFDVFREKTYSVRKNPLLGNEGNLIVSESFRLLARVAELTSKD